MKDDVSLIKKRLQTVKYFYNKTEDMINKLPDNVPSKVKNELKRIILGDKELKDLMDSIDTNRPPRIFLVGRTGVGKSSLINALCGTYLAEVSDTMSCTTKTKSYQCMKDDNAVMEILDTRGINESLSVDDKESAEEVLIKDMKVFSPDVAILVLNSTHRDDVDKDVLFLKDLSDKYKKINSIDLPIVVVINKCDEVAPSRFKNPLEYPDNKIKNIEEIKRYFKEIIINNGLKVEDIVCISSLIDWKTSDGVSVSMENIKSIPNNDSNNLEIEFDGRYNIDKLLDVLELAIKDNDARMGLRIASRLDTVIRNVAKKLNAIFSSISATVAVTPIPVADIYVLLIIQMSLVTLIAALSGREITSDTAKEFVFSMGGITGTGFVLREIARQGVKFFPGVGSFISATIASSGTYAMGEAAIAYYIDGKDIEEVKKIFNTLISKKDKK